MGLKANADGSGAIQVGGSDAITITSGLNTTFAGTASVATGTLYPLVSGTVNNGGTNPFPSSGGPTLVDFTSIPSWVKRITVMFNGVSTSGTSLKQIQLGAGAITTSGYSGGYGGGGAAAWNGGTISSGVALGNSALAADTLSGIMLITNVTANTWTMSYSGGSSSGNFAQIAGGAIALSGTLDRVRITTVNGTDTFDAGSINILYE